MQKTGRVLLWFFGLIAAGFVILVVLLGVFGPSFFKNYREYAEDGLARDLVEDLRIRVEDLQKAEPGKVVPSCTDTQCEQAYPGFQMHRRVQLRVDASEHAVTVRAQRIGGKKAFRWSRGGGGGVGFGNSQGAKPPAPPAGPPAFPVHLTNFR